MRKLISFALLLCICVAALHFGGFSFEQFKSQTHLRNPGTVLDPILPNVSGGGGNSSNNNSGYTFDPNASLGGNGNSNNPSSEIPDIDYSGNGDSNLDNINPGNKDENPSDENSSTDNPSDKEDSTSNVDTTDNPKSDNNIEDTTSENNENEDKDKPTKGKTETTNTNNIINLVIDGNNKVVTSDNAVDFVQWLQNNFKDNSNVSTEPSTEPIAVDLPNDDYTALASSINTINALPTYTDYNRNSFEKPIKSYTLDGKKVNRNDYAWKTSVYFDEETFTYTCPYTGKVITDLDDGKEDKDYGNIDFDHIVPLKSAYLRGAKDWTDEQKNAYAYDQSIGVDVLNSANRSKSDKGPAEWLPDINRGSYCYSWLVICEKYNLSMTEEEIKICNDEIAKAVNNGETITFMGGSYNG